MGRSGPGVWDVVIVSTGGQRTPILGGSQWEGYFRHFGLQTGTRPHFDNAFYQALAHQPLPSSPVLAR
jgi:hypothetical protein